MSLLKTRNLARMNPPLTSMILEMMVRGENHAIKENQRGRKEHLNANIAIRHISKETFTISIFKRTVSFHIRVYARATSPRNQCLLLIIRLNFCLYDLGPDGSLLVKCECCYTYFKTKEEQQKHTIAKHRDRVTCKICNKMYKNIDSVYSHKQTAHAGYKYKLQNFVCTKCGQLHF